MNALSGKTAIIAGGSRGIGLAIARELSRHGARTVLCARDLEALYEAARTVRAAGGPVATMACDLARPEAALEVVSFALVTFGAIDILVNCAGGSKRGSIKELSDDDWSSAFELKLLGAMRLTRAAWPHLSERKGSVVNIAGAAGRTPRAGHAIAAATNGAFMALTKSLADLGIADGVRVNAINPGVVRTRRLDADLQARGALPDDDAARAAALGTMAKQMAMTRIGEPSDIAAMVTHLVSPQGSWFNGALIDLDGGATKGI